MFNEKEYQKEYREKNKEKINARRQSEEHKKLKREYYHKNKEKYKRDSEYWKKYYEKNREKRINQSREYYEKNKEKTKAYQGEYKKTHEYKSTEINLKRKYGLSLLDYEKITKDQQSLCACCGQSAKKLFVDHCHKTKKVRGLLCRNCNTMLGFARDVPSILEAGARYLRKHRSKHIEQTSLPL